MNNDIIDCPCGCDGIPEYCSYASTCNVCKKKYYGLGYCETNRPCFDCEKNLTRPIDVANLSPSEKLGYDGFIEMNMTINFFVAHWPFSAFSRWLRRNNYIPSER